MTTYTFRWLTFLLLSLFSSVRLSVFAQVSGYSFQQQSSIFMPLTQGTPLLIDDVTSPAVAIGFPFQFNGQHYDTVRVSEKGWLWFGPASSFVAHPHPIGGPAFNGPVSGIICAFGNDLIPDLFNASASVLVQRTGTAPNRILTVEWRAFTRIQPVADGTSDVLNFQIELLEGSHQIRMNYHCFAAPWSPPSPPEPNDISKFIQVGLRGSGEQDFHLRTGFWATSSQASDLSRRLVFSDSMLWEPRNIRYTWTPGQTTLSILTGNLPSGTACSTSPAFLPFTTTGTFPPGNVFVAQLSAANGTFSANPTLVGEGTTSPISLSLPATALGSHYKLRVVSLNPAVIGSESQPFSITNCCNTQIQLTGPTPLCQGDSVILTAGPGLSYEWLPTGDTTQSIVVRSGGFYSVKVRKSPTCLATAGVQVGFNAVNPLVVTANTTTLSPGQTAVLTANGGVHYSWSPPAGLSSTNGQSVVATPTQTTTYTAQSILPSGCLAKGSITLVVEGPGGNVAPVTIFPGTGTFPGPQAVGMSCVTPGATIYYTLTGNTPVPGTSFTRVYSEPFTVLQTTTVKALAMKAGMTSSSLQTAVLTIANPGVVAQPQISPNGGTHEGSVEVHIECPTPEAQIWYTTNGNLPRLDVPNSFTRRYTGPFTLFESTTIRAVAIKSGVQNSAVSLARVSVTNAQIVAPVQFSPIPGTYPEPQTVQLSSATPDVQIWYSTNGNTPRVDVPNFFTRLYATPLNINQTTQLKALAVRPGYRSSPVAVGNYTIGAFRMAVNSDIQLTLFPNPAVQEKVTVSWESEDATEESQLLVLDIQGKVLVSKRFPPEVRTETLDLQEFGKGLYWVRLRQGTRVKSQTLRME